jgi:folate-binding protein YgfZ
MRIYLLNKMVIRILGNAAQFLSGLTSNTLDAPQNAFLNLHGRIIATFEQVRTGEDEFLLVLAPSAWESLKAHTDRYARLNKTTIEPVSRHVYFDLDSTMPLEPKDHTVVQKAGRLVVTDRTLSSTISDSEFTRFRLEYQLPMHTVDYGDDMVLNVHEHDFVSYTKGCFLGQEPVAKVHNRSKPTWKLSVCYLDELTAEDQAKATSVVEEPVTGRRRGFVFVKNS